MKPIADRIQKYNRSRRSDFVQLKYKALTENAYRFFRGTAHIFYEDFSKHPALLKTPSTWLCGDLHLENFGSYKSANRLIYFDINDFDEAYFGPCAFDVTRLLVSIIISCREVGIREKELRKLCSRFMNDYFTELGQGHASRIEYAISSGIIKTYFDHLSSRKRDAFIRKRVSRVKGKLKLKIDKVKYFELSSKEYRRVEEAVKQWVKANKQDAGFFRIHDIAYRVAGTGSLGLDRYAVLVSGKGYPKNYILDVKEAVASSVQTYFPKKKLQFENDADRIVAVQKRMQDSSVAYLSSLSVEKKWFVIREHQPSEDKMDLHALSRNTKYLGNYIEHTAQLLAWAQIRSSGYR
ncbi:MAG: DUF2252 family protein [Bacteroidetes bacterium]|nr:DUF2252 family protein [Bacteroidota bacterium]